MCIRDSLLDIGDIEEAMNAAHAVGDDTLQEQAYGYSVPDSFTHGKMCIRDRLSSSRNNDDFLFLFLVFTGFSIVSFLLIACYNGMTAIEPPLLTITDDAIYKMCIRDSSEVATINWLPFDQTAVSNG